MEGKLVFLLFLVGLMFAFANSQPMADDASSQDGDGTSMGDEYDDVLERLLSRTQKRSCIRRMGACDHRPNDCCYNSSCRCNLWGTNCRCQRMGLFQKWGK